jgi:hypothetical protein
MGMRHRSFFMKKSKQVKARIVNLNVEYKIV